MLGRIGQGEDSADTRVCHPEKAVGVVGHELKSKPGSSRDRS